MFKFNVKNHFTQLFLIFIEQQWFFVFLSVFFGMLYAYPTIDYNRDYDGTLFVKRLMFVAVFNGFIFYVFLNFLNIFFRKKMLVGYFCSILFLFLFFINVVKSKILNFPLVFQDFALVGEAYKVVSLDLKVYATLFFLIAIVVGFFIYKLHRREQKKDNLSICSIFIFVIGTALISFNAYIMRIPFDKCPDKYNYTICHTNLYYFPSTVRWNGDLATMHRIGYLPYIINRTIDDFTKDAKVDISETQVNQILKNDDMQTQVFENKPNIVVILHESLIEPKVLDKGLIAEKTPFIDMYKKSNFLSPAFGGQTANVEFEILTGLNISYYLGELMYVNRVKKDIYSLPRYLQKFGYQSVAIHNYPGGYYNRDKAYQYLGFNNFISIEKMIPNIINTQINIKKESFSDDLVYDQILNTLKNNQDRPKFIHAITVKNHGDYQDDRYGIKDFHFEKQYDKDAKQGLSTYAAGVIDADQKMLNLVQRLSEVKQPTILVVYGDHHPYIKNVSEIDGKTNKDIEKYETPLMVWSNFSIDENQFDSPYIASHFLATKILKSIHFPLQSYFGFMNSVADCYDAIHPQFILKKENCNAENGQKLLEQYKLINQDVLSGQNHSYELLQK
ncbi:LTA synthase family protein [Acinetobacter sp. c2-A9]|uniref:LTA synthase family protein n=1 Tax=Acinetobacter sp. c2-A9 TaxID=3342802 RepID=UPI0035B750F4